MEVWKSATLVKIKWCESWKAAPRAREMEDRKAEGEVEGRRNAGR